MERHGGHAQYFNRYFSEVEASLKKVVEILRSFNTGQCEIIATLYSAWHDLLKEDQPVSDDRIVHEVLTNWHESKKRIPRERWEKALVWMRQNELVPITVNNIEEIP